MSQNIFQIDPIFFLPIDLEGNSKNFSETSETEEETQNDIIINNHFKKIKKMYTKRKLLSMMKPQTKILLQGKN